MPADLRQLLVEQANAIASIKRVLVNFKKLPKANITLPRTKGRLEDLKEIWRTVQQLHNRLCLVATTEERKTAPYFLNDSYFEAEDAYNEAADHLNKTMGRLCKTETPSSKIGSDSSYREACSDNALQLPRISLPKFSGNFLEWENFRNTFESLVVSNETLTNTQKFHYLKSSLQGDAALLIANLRISDANYESAWQLLVNEYDDGQALVHAHIHSFVSLPPMKLENVHGLKKLRDTLSASLAALANLGRPVDKWDDIIIYIVSQKFSQRTRQEWNLRRSSSSSELPSYKDLNNFLTLRIRGLTDPSESAFNASNVSHNHKPKSSVNNVVVVKCANCSGNHNITKCEDFLAKSVVQRSTTVEQNKLCFNCLRSGHFTPTCKTKARCRHCGRSHHSLLHAVKSTTSMDCVANTQETDDASQCHKESVAVNNAVIATVLTVQTQITPAPIVLLATAWVTVHTLEGRSFKVRALLDQGSTFSFISEALFQTLRTKRYRADLQIRCFGENYTGRAKTRVVINLSPCSQT